VLLFRPLLSFSSEDTPTAQEQVSFVQTEMTSVAARPVTQLLYVNALTIKGLEFIYSFALLFLPILALLFSCSCPWSPVVSFGI